MYFQSTRAKAYGRTMPPPVPMSQALLEGLAPDGGLYSPVAPLQPFPEGALEALVDEVRSTGDLPPARTGSMVLRHVFGGPEGLPDEALDRIAEEALNFPIPLVPLSNGWAVLELFHGPTLAFKDIGARVMARLLSEVMKHDDPSHTAPLTVLVATSGDTGGAVASAFHKVPGTRVVVLYPKGQVSPRQEAQFTTLGGNITAFRVEGTFDDCQRMVKLAFMDDDLKAHFRFTSANSINIGRFLPQMIMHVHGWALASGGAAGEKLAHDGPVYMGVPSGNFGNLAAGLLAREMGLPLRKLVAGNNTNNPVTQYLKTGHYQTRPSVRTHSSAMDVGSPSNWERIEELIGPDVSLKTLQTFLTGSHYSDGRTEDAIRRIHRTLDYVIDPHGAVGFLALERAVDTESAIRTAFRLLGRVDDDGLRPILMATAHPAKFPEVVEQVLRMELPLPATLAERLEHPRSFVDVGPAYFDFTDALKDTFLPGGGQTQTPEAS